MALENQTSQLDRLGRELKCPICLSLFKQAASLSCNHTFCMSCITQSMKRNPVCPICKVHTTRREVRAAPQMDTLVGIFVNLGSAAGMDCVASQFTSATEPVHTTAKKQGSKQRQALSNITNKDGAAGSKAKKAPNTEQLFKGPVGPNKRIQVPQFMSLSGDLGIQQDEAKVSPRTKNFQETIPRQISTGHVMEASGKKVHEAEIDAELPLSERPSNRSKKHNKKKAGKSKENKISNQESKPPLDNHIALNTQVSKDDIGRLTLDPFFWLRDEDSRDTDAIPTTNELVQVTPNELPTFSDLKDSDDNISIHGFNEEAKRDAATADSYDSDYFEWTQQPCSPELKCSPAKQQQVPGEDIVIDLAFEGAEFATECLLSDNPDALEKPMQDQPSSDPQTSKPTDKKVLSQVLKSEKTIKEYIVERKRDRQKKHSKTVPLSESGSNIKKINKAIPKSSVEAAVCTDHSKGMDENTGLNKRNHSKGIDENTGPNKRKSADLVKPAKRRKTHFHRRSTDGSKLDSLRLDEFAKQGDVQVNNAYPCAFCRATGDSQVAGPLMHFTRSGIPVETFESCSKIIHVHKHCAEWAPDVYFEEDIAKNLTVEIARGQKIKCSSCGQRGAALGCCLKRCRRSYHYPCAQALSCKWEEEKFIILCPEHATERFPTKRQARRNQQNASSGIQGLPTRHSQGCSNAAGKPSLKWPSGPASKWVLAGSAMDSETKEQLAVFARFTGASIAKTWCPTITHVVAGTDEDGAARRTLKYLMGLLEGKWIVRLDWIKACTSAGEPVNEEVFEVKIDIHGVVDGPKRGRLLAASKAPKLFEGLKFYFMPSFPASYKNDLQSLIVAAGGGVLHRKPIHLEGKSQQERTIVIYNKDDESKDDQAKLNNARKQAEAITMGALVGAQVVPHSWILDSIASCRVQPLA